jgi:hypothetical protein
MNDPISFNITNNLGETIYIQYNVGSKYRTCIHTQARFYIIYWK